MTSASSTSDVSGSPSASQICQKVAKPGNRPTKYRDCTPMFSLSVHKVQKVLSSGRRSAKTELTEIVLVASNVEKKGQNPSPCAGTVGIAKIKPTLRSKPSRAGHAMELVDKNSVSALKLEEDPFNRLIPRKQSCSEKVSKWLEECDYSDISTAVHNLDEVKEQAMYKRQERSESLGAHGTPANDTTYALQGVERMSPITVQLTKRPLEALVDEVGGIRLAECYGVKIELSKGRRLVCDYFSWIVNPDAVVAEGSTTLASNMTIEVHVRLRADKPFAIVSRYMFNPFFQLRIPPN